VARNVGSVLTRGQVGPTVRRQEDSGAQRDSWQGTVRLVMRVPSVYRVGVCIGNEEG
jgi:hypothetical protein